MDSREALYQRFPNLRRTPNPQPARKHVITVRVEKPLFDAVHDQAHRERISLNQWCVERLAGGLDEDAASIASETGAEPATASA